MPFAKHTFGSLELPSILMQQFNRLRLAILNRVLSDGGIGVATTTSKARSNATITYTVDGEFKSKASTDNLWTPNGDNVPAGQFQKWLLCLDAAGAASAIAGVAASTAAAVILPEAPESKAVVGQLTVQNGSAADFVPGTTLLGAAGITATYFDGYPAGLLQEITTS